MRIFSRAVVLAAGTLCVAAVSSSAFAGGTTRIETRPFYGAVVTEEEGVRVFRPLPPTERVIINPGGRTPLSLGFNETHVTEENHNYNYNQASSDDNTGVTTGGHYYGGHRLGHGRHGKRGHGPPASWWRQWQAGIRCARRPSLRRVCRCRHSDLLIRERGSTVK